MAEELDEYLQNDLKLTLKASVILKRILKYIVPYIWWFILGILIYVVMAALTVYEPIIIGDIINIFKDDSSVLQDVLSNATIYAICIILVAFLMYLNGFIIQKVAQSVIYDLRKDVFKHIEYLAIGQIHEIPVGKWVTRVTNDTNSLMNFFSTVLTRIFYNVMTLVEIFVMIYLLDWHLALVLTCALPIVIVISGLFAYYSRKYHRLVRSNISQLNAFLSENLTGMNTIQIFNQEQRKKGEFGRINENLKKSQYKATDMFAIFRPLIFFTYVMTIVFVFAIGLPLVRDNVIEIGTVYTFYMYTGNFFNPVQEIADQFNNIQQALASSERIVLVLDKKSDVTNKEGARDIEKFKGKIEFKNVWFAYKEDEWILKDVSFVINPGDTVAFVGETGAGKSTIIGLIVRNYNIQKGQILIDDIDINDITLESLRRNIGEMLQDVFLFSGTVKSNISLGDESISDDEIKEACKFVGASNFIEKLPNKYDEEVNENGNNFSQGQRQLISFARVVSYKPSIIVLDEATANIDTETEVIIQESLEKIKSIGTMVMVAHRLSTIRHATMIYVVDKGEIKERGNHQQLLKKRGIYYNLYKIQNMEKKMKEDRRING